MIRRIIKRISKNKSIRNLPVDSDFNPPVYSPYYLIRRGILEGIYENKNYIKGKVLDFGCGTKPYKYVFAEVTEYIGVDFENTGHPHEGEHIDFFYNGKHLPFSDNTFDAILSTEVFEHIFNIDELISELYRVLKPGGFILITCPFVYPEHEAPYDFARYTHFGLINIFENAGFNLIVVDKKGNLKETIAQQLIIHHVGKIRHFSLLQNSKLFSHLLQSIISLFYNLPCITIGKLTPGSYHLYSTNIIVAQK